MTHPGLSVPPDEAECRCVKLIDKAEMHVKGHCLEAIDRGRMSILSTLNHPNQDVSRSTF